METVVGGLFNAVAFAGAGARFLFSKLNHTGYEKEIKRHNEAMEQLSRDKEKWYENQVKRKEQMELLRQQLSNFFQKKKELIFFEILLKESDMSTMKAQTNFF